MRQTAVSSKTRKIALLGIFTAISVILALLTHVPVFPAAPFLEYDAADIPIFFITFLYGPWYALFMTVTVSILQGVSVSSGGGIFGILMHIAATGSFVIVCGLLYRKFPSLKGAALSLFCGTLVWLVVMIAFNLAITPLFMKVSLDQVLQMLLPVIIPFNIIKAAPNSIAAFFLYKSLSYFIEKYGQKMKGKPKNKKSESLPASNDNKIANSLKENEKNEDD